MTVAADASARITSCRQRQQRDQNNIYTMETSSGSSRRRNLSPARRKFYARPESLRGRRRNDPENSARLAQTIRESVVGRNASFDGPFGRKNAVYCDFVASGKAVNFIEDFISDHVS